MRNFPVQIFTDLFISISKLHIFPVGVAMRPWGQTVGLRPFVGEALQDHCRKDMANKFQY
jgi:hypothetical protein